MLSPCLSQSLLLKLSRKYSLSSKSPSHSNHTNNHPVLAPGTCSLHQKVHGIHEERASRSRSLLLA